MTQKYVKNNARWCVINTPICKFKSIMQLWLNYMNGSLTHLLFSIKSLNFISEENIYYM